MTMLALATTTAIGQHDMTMDSSNTIGPDSPLLDMGQTYTWTANATGSYQYHCHPHPNMTGTITVTDAMNDMPTYAVTIQDYAFNPPTLTVPMGAQVTWTNQDATMHTVTNGSGQDAAPMMPEAAPEWWDVPPIVGWAVLGVVALFACFIFLQAAGWIR